jgi:putative ABC transport system permease protein
VNIMNTDKHNLSAPKIPMWLIRRLFRCENRDEYAGDIEEEFADIQSMRGRRKALMWIWNYAVLGIPRGLYSFYVWRLTMFKNYFKITFRNIRKYKGFSLINFTGLVIGLTFFVLIMLFVLNELSYDSMHTEGDRIHRVVFQSSRGGMEKPCAVTPAPLASKLMNELPEVALATKIWPSDRLLLTRDTRSFFERGLYADEHFLNVFSFPLLKGDRALALKDLDSIVISRRLAQKFFPGVDPIGKTLSHQSGDLIVTGVAADVPENSHIQFDWIIPFERSFSPEEREERMNRWNLDNYYTYVMLKEDASPDDFKDKTNTLMSAHYMALKSSTGKGWWELRAGLEHFLQPLKSIHLKSNIQYEFSANGDIRLIRLFIIIAVFILIIACINAVNLSTAMAAKRTKEIGIRKVVGAIRRQLVQQFMGESFIITFISLTLTVGLVYLLLPGFSRLMDRTLLFDQLGNRLFILGLPLVGILTGFAAGLYPALFLTSFQPVTVLGRRAGLRQGRNYARNSLVVFQFAITIALVISSTVIFSQIRFIKNRNLGYNREQIVVLRGSDPGLQKNYKAFKNILLENPQVMSFSTANQLPTNISWAGGIPIPNDEGELVRLHSYFLRVDYEFLDVLGMELAAGRNFAREYGTDVSEAVIINEAYLNKMGWEQPLGKRLHILNSEQEHEIIGVVKNFHFHSLRQEITPLVISLQPDSFYTFLRIRPEKIPETIGFIGETYDRFKIRYPFEYFFLADQFNRIYRSEEKLSRIILLFSGLTCFIACLGIFGLSMSRAQKRTKEIGIRKVLGATGVEIAGLLTKDFLKLVLAANIFAWPLAFFAMHSWLQGFSYRIGLGLKFFLLSSLITIIIALLATAYQSIKAALSDPTRSLRYE